MSALPLVGARGEGRGPLGAAESTSPLSPLPVIRPAVLTDVPALETLTAPFVASGDLLPRSNYDLCRHIKEWLVVEAGGGRGGEIVACGALKIYSATLAELAGLAVRDDWQGRGLGKQMVEALIAEARAHGLTEVLALTRKPDFFHRLGFELSDRHHFPIKVWADCARCPRQSCCDEIAVTLRL